MGCSLNNIELRIASIHSIEVNSILIAAHVESSSRYRSPISALTIVGLPLHHCESHLNRERHNLGNCMMR